MATLATAIDAAAASGSPLTASQFESCVRDVSAGLELGAGDLIHPARVALTGQARSAGMFEVMELIGAPRVVARLRRAAGP